MLDKFREDLEQLLYDYAKVGIKLNSLEYDVVNVFYYDKEDSKHKTVKDLENLKFNIEVSNDT